MPAKALNENRLEAILIAKMAAALHGAPGSAIDIDLYFRKTPANMPKLKQVAGGHNPALLLAITYFAKIFKISAWGYVFWVVQLIRAVMLEIFAANFLARSDGNVDPHRAVLA